MDKRDVRKALSDAKSAMQAAEAELEATRQRVRDLEEEAKAAERAEGITKRDVAKTAWVAPIVLAVNLPNSLFAQNAVSPVPAPPTPGPAPSSNGPSTLAPSAPSPLRTPSTAVIRIGSIRYHPFQVLVDFCDGNH